MKLSLLATALLAIATAVPAFADNNNVCLYRRYLDGWNVRDKTSMVVDQFGRKYLVNLQGDCHDLPFAEVMGFRSPARAGGLPCVGSGDHVVLRGGGAMTSSPSMCWVTNVQHYTKKMQAADRVAREEHRPLPAF